MSLGLCEGNQSVIGSPHKGLLMRNTFPCNDVIMVKQICIEPCISIMLLQWAIHLEISFEFLALFDGCQTLSLGLLLPFMCRSLSRKINTLMPMRLQWMKWTITGPLCAGRLGTNFNEIVKIQRFSFQNALKMLCTNCRQFPFVFGVLDM